jgi:hypothetical protein
MSRGRRKRKRKAIKQRKLPTIVPPSLKRAESPPAIEVAILRPDKAVFTSKEVLIAAPIEHCFGVIASQLEKPCQWDPIIFNAQPVSDVRRQIGATSQVILDLGGRRVDSQAMISRYHPNRGFSWATTQKPKIRQDWRLEMKPGSTLVRVSLAHELNSWAITRLIYKVTRWKRVEEDMDKMLKQLKEAAESTRRD